MSLFHSAENTLQMSLSPAGMGRCIHSKILRTLAAIAFTVSVGLPVSPARGDTPAKAKQKKQISDSQTRAANAQASAYKSGARALSRAFRDAAKEASPSVVTVFSYGQNSDENPANKTDEELPAPLDPTDDSVGPTPPKQSEDGNLPLSGLGSGVIVNPFAGMKKSGNQQFGGPWVLTNHHVIRDAKKVVIQLPDDTEIDAELVNGDASSDVAVLRLKTNQKLATAKFGDSDTLEIGDWVLAIGSPFKLEATVSAGIISAKNREISRIKRGRLLQTDAAINPGNSGGPLIDLDGKVIAISTAIATRNGGYQGIGFAIPINQARWIARELAIHGSVRRAAIGVRLAELTPKIAGKLNLPANLGVLVYQVIKDSAADRAGLKSMDIILEFAGQRVRKPGSLQEAVEREPIGSTQQVKISRGGKELTKEIVLAPLDDPTAVDPAGESSNTDRSQDSVD